MYTEEEEREEGEERVTEGDAICSFIGLVAGGVVAALDECVNIERRSTNSWEMRSTVLMYADNKYETDQV